jgi:aspartate aminotransferase
MQTAVDSLRPLLEPQERLDQLISATFRRSGRKVVDLSYANVHDGPDAEVRRALVEAAAGRGPLSFQYSPYGGRTGTRRAIAAALTTRFGLPFAYADVVLTPGAMAALNVVLRALFGPDDEVIVLTPCWHDYTLYLRHLGIPVRLVPLGSNKHLDLQTISGAINERTKGLLLSQPCCPTGVLYARQEIERLAALLRESEDRFGTQIYLISDEVHRDLVWSGRTFHSPLSSYPRACSVYSFGKALALQGQRIGYIAVSPLMPDGERIRQMLERCLRFMGFCTPTDLMQRAVCSLLDHRPDLEALATRQDTVRTALRGYGYSVCEADATFFVYVASPLREDVRFAELLADQGVLVVPSSLFNEPGYVRLSLTARSESIAAALPVFEAVLQRV